MAKEYVAPKAEMVKFETMDIITSSDCQLISSKIYGGPEGTYYEYYR